jgi:hypothetical protein
VNRGMRSSGVLLLMLAVPHLNWTSTPGEAAPWLRHGGPGADVPLLERRPAMHLAVL